VLVTQHGVDYDLQQVAQHLLSAGLSKEKLPERLLCTTDVPRSPDGKVLKAQLRDQVIASL
jgi:acyl-CoA synthetase